MRRWLDPKWYAFLWQRNDRRGLAVVIVLLVAGLGAGGYAAAGSLQSNDTAVGVVKLEAVNHTVRVRGRDRVVTHYVTLATTDVAPPSTVVQTRVVTRPVVHTVQAAPIVRRQVVHVTDKGRTVTRERVETQIRTRTETQIATETNVQTVTQPATVVQSKTVTRRVTTTAPGTTVTVTGAIITVTLPGKTVTRTTTVTVTSPQLGTTNR